MSKIKNEYIREFASFSGKCPYNCLHCYTFIPEYRGRSTNTIDEIISDLKNKIFDVIYISGHRENFVDPDKGLDLSEAIFDNFNCDILITTRNVFNEQQLERLSKLNDRMKENGKDLFFCISIPALNSYRKLEQSKFIPTPEQRMKFLKAVYLEGIYTFLTIKPLCPNEFIPIEESMEIVNRCHDFSTVILSSGIVVDKKILNRMKNFPTKFVFTENKLMECLENDINVKYVDVSEEISNIRDLCQKYSVPFFEHSIPANQHIKKIRKN